MAIVVKPFNQSSIVVKRKNFLINFNLEKLLSALATLIGRVNNILKTIPRFGAKSSEECLTTQRGSGDPFLDLKTRKLFCSTGECNTNSSTTDDQPVAKDFSPSPQGHLKHLLGDSFRFLLIQQYD
ncbi:hypothetical protein TNCV_619691 [Trichonephila clavipes]|nr:hypothetical protein TNCV_619691 [Trichonephila clavipes]